MPLFPGCEQVSNFKKENQCADLKLLEFIDQYIRYPEAARRKGVEDTCVVSFVINREGYLEIPMIRRDIGGGCGVEALRIVRLMQAFNLRWSPGIQNGEPVKVEFNLPVKFRLE